MVLILKNFVTSLSSALERRHHIAQIFNEQGIDFEFFDAITPEKAYDLKEKYFLTIADVIPYNNFLNYDLKNIDLIISTINIEEKQSKIPVIKVSPLLGEDDEIKIKRYLNEKTYEKINLEKVIEIVERYSKIEDKEKLGFYKIFYKKLLEVFVCFGL